MLIFSCYNQAQKRSFGAFAVASKFYFFQDLNMFLTLERIRAFIVKGKIIFFVQLGTLQSKHRTWEEAVFGKSIEIICENENVPG